MIQTDASKITQKELDHIHRMTKIARIGRINAQVRTKKSCEHVRILREALENCVLELRQYHTHYNPKCEGGCPALVYIEEAETAIAKAKGS